MIINMLRQGFEVNAKLRREEEAGKQGIFRSGNAGYISHGVTHASCGRLALLRYKGVNNEIGFDEHLSVTTGILHEHHVTDLLLAAPEVEKVEVWEEVPQTNDKIVVHKEALAIDLDGVVISGRPDRVVVKKGQRLGIELKTVISPNTAHKITKEFPSMQYLSQVLTYQHALKVPFNFVFGQYFIADKWIGKQRVVEKPRFLEFSVEPVSEVKTHVFRLDKNGQPTEDKVFDLGIAHIRDYYLSLKQAAENETVPERPVWESYNKCDYCAFNQNCNSFDNGFITTQEWVELCK